MKNIILDLDENLIKEVENVLDYECIDMNLAIQMFLKRVVKEKTITFLFKNNHSRSCAFNRSDSIAEEQNLNGDSLEVKSVALGLLAERSEMTKSIAIRMFRGKGFNIGKNVTYASKNRSAYNYWANPDYGMLSVEWNLILNDWLNKKLYLFTIPPHSIDEDQLIPRNDKNDLIDLQIMYNDATFTDNRSGVSFVNYLIVEIQY